MQATVDALAKIAAAANGFADNGATLNAADYASLGLASIDAARNMIAELADTFNWDTESEIVEDFIYNLPWCKDTFIPEACPE